MKQKSTQKTATTSGIITTIAGNGIEGNGSGNVYIADGGNFRIRKVNSSGIVTTIGGSTAGFSGDGEAATAAKLDNPYSITMDGSGNVYFADIHNNRIRKISH